MDSTPTVFLVDDDDALRAATARLLGTYGLRVEGHASAEEFLASFDATRPGCVLLDLRMPGQSGLELQAELTARGITLPVVFLTGHADVPTSVYAMRQGALDFLQKPVREEELIAALERAIERDRELRARQDERAALEERYATLTTREVEVLEGLLAGRLNKQIGFALGIAERTVKLHRANVLDKMGVASLTELAEIVGRLNLGRRPH